MKTDEPKNPRPRCPVCDRVITAADRAVGNMHPACDPQQARLFDEANQ